MRSLLPILLLLFSVPALCAPSSFFDGALEVEVPAVFRAMDQAAIDQMFSGARAKPEVVLATPDSETRISMTHASAPLGPADLEATKDSLKARVDGGAPVQWARDEMVTLNGQPWFRLDYDLSQEKKREIILGTSMQGRLLFLVIATPGDDLELLEGDLESLIASLKVTP